MRNSSCALAAAVGGTLLHFACGPGAAKPEAPPQGAKLTLSAEQLARVKVELLVESSFRRAVETTGTVAFNADHSTQVQAPISGPVSRLLVSVGAEVKAGEVLATVVSPDYASAVSTYRKALAEASNARRVATLDEELFKNDGIARRDMEQAETDAVSAEADRDSALQELHSLGLEETALEAIRQGRPVPEAGGAIRSPIDGTIVEKLITPGQLLQAGAAGVAGTPCFTVADLSTVWVMANIFESDLGSVSVGDPAEITTAASPEAFPGTVDYVAALVDPSTRAISVRILARNPRRILKRDLYVRVAIQSKRDSQGLLAPVSSVLRDDANLPFVYVQNADGGFARRPVTLGSQLKDRYEIRAGLAPGTRVVAEGGLFMQFAESQ